jgi:hypothetical protein
MRIPIGVDLESRDGGVTKDATPLLMLKNRTQAFSVNKSGTIAAITLPSGLGTTLYSVTSLTRSGGTATATLAGTDAQIDVGSSVTIAGANEVAYNGAQTVLTATPYSHSAARSITISSLTRSGTTATAVAAAHGLTTATAYAISGANESAYNGSKTITVVDADTFTYTVTVTTYAAITGTWNPADKAAAVTLSGGNLIASSNPTTSGSAASVRGTVSKSATQWVWELTLGRSYLSYFGAATSGQSLTGSPLATTTAWVWSTNYLVHNGVFTSVGPFANGDVVAVAFDGDADTLSFYKNGVRVGGFTGVSGTILPFFGAFEDGGPDTRQATANFAGHVHLQLRPAQHPRHGNACRC